MKEQKSLGFIMLKPLGCNEPLRTEILERLQQVTQIVGLKRVLISQVEAEALYGPSGHFLDGSPRPHFYAIVNYLNGKTVEVMMACGNGDPERLIRDIDEIIGDWRPEETRDGQIRNLVISRAISYIMAVETPEGSNRYCYDNLIHSSDSLESAMREISVFFSSEEVDAILNQG